MTFILILNYLNKRNVINKNYKILEVIIMSQMTDRELLELIAAQVANLTNDMLDVKKNISTLESEVKDIKNKLNGLENKVDSNHDEVMRNIEEIKNNLHELEGKNAANHVSVNTRLDKISDDLDFLAHKEFLTEKEVYNLKKKLIK